MSTDHLSAVQFVLCPFIFNSQSKGSPQFHFPSREAIRYFQFRQEIENANQKILKIHACPAHGGVNPVKKEKRLVE